MKKLISLITAVLLSFSCVITAVAATQFSDGVYTFEQNSFGNAVITDCNLTDENIDVPMFVLNTPVIGIGDYAFFSNSYIRTVTLPDTVISIGEYGFANNPDLENVTIPRWCDTIAENAFWNSPNVTISCYTDTAAQRYAEEHEMAYALLDAVVPKTDVSGAEIALETSAVRYNGAAHMPAVTVTLGEIVLDPETDYTVEYSDNLNPGEATITVTGTGDYEGEAVAHFAIRNVLGDTDGDGEVGITDATLILRQLVHIRVPDPERVEQIGDVNGDGLDIIDATYIQRYIVNMAVPYPINEMIIE